MSEHTYNVITPGTGVPIKAWTRGVPLEDAARNQLLNVAQLPFIYKWVAAMPDVHWGIGATVGSVIPTRGAIIPAAVGVDIGCGMMAVQTSLHAKHLPDNLHGIRTAIEKAVPHGRTDHGRANDRGAWSDAPSHHAEVWGKMEPAYKAIIDKYPKLNHVQRINHLGTLGTGNHFIEVCLDENENVWFLLHSGSRGVGNRFGTFFIELAKNDMRQWMINLPDQDLAYLPQGTEHFVFMSCSHGAGRAMSRTEAKRRFTLDDHAKATAGVECRKDADVIDETPMAYKSIDAVMEAQRDLVDMVHTLRQVVCVKG